jgi:hypothetical protein
MSRLAHNCRRRPPVMMHHGGVSIFTLGCRHHIKKSFTEQS